MKKLAFKPCPHCGGHAHYLWNGERRPKHLYGIVCLQCGCRTACYFKTYAKAAVVWNRRPRKTAAQKEAKP